MCIKLLETLFSSLLLINYDSCRWSNKQEQNKLGMDSFEQNSDGNGICDICGNKVVTSGNTTNLFKVYSLHESLK